MEKSKFIAHGFSKGEAVLYKGQPAQVISVHINSHGWMHLMVAFGPEGRGRNFAACGADDIELPEKP